MKKFDNVDLIKIVTLGCDFFASFMLSLLLAIQGDERAEAISALVLSVALPTVAYIIGAIICFIYILKIEKEKNWQYLLQLISIAIGGLLYLTGDNLPPVMEGYGNQLNCCEGCTCLRQIQAAGFGLLVIATVTNFPTFIDKLLFHSAGDECDSDTILMHVRVFFLMASFHELDTLYTALQRVTSTCPDDSTVISIWISWVVYTVAFLLVLIFSVNLHFKCKKDNTVQHKDNTGQHRDNIGQQKCFKCKNSICDCIGSNIHSILLFICLASYLLADNRLPLACTGAAKSSYTDRVSNSLNSTLCNNMHYNDTMNTLHIIQVSLWAPVVTIALYALFFTIGWCLCCQRKKPSQRKKSTQSSGHNEQHTCTKL